MTEFRAPLAGVTDTVPDTVNGNNPVFPDFNLSVDMDAGNDVDVFEVTFQPDQIITYLIDTPNAGATSPDVVLSILDGNNGTVLNQRIDALDRQFVSLLVDQETTQFLSVAAASGNTETDVGSVFVQRGIFTLPDEVDLEIEAGSSNDSDDALVPSSGIVIAVDLEAGPAYPINIVTGVGDRSAIAVGVSIFGPDGLLLAQSEEDTNNFTASVMPVMDGTHYIQLTSNQLGSFAGISVEVGEGEGLNAVDDGFAVDPGGELTDDVSTNDDAEDAGAPRWVLVDDVEDGSLSFNNDGTFTYTPEQGFEGQDQFTYQIVDDTSQSDDTDTATVTIDVAIQKNVIRGTGNPDTLNGDGRADEIYGLGNADRIFGAGGNDCLFGGGGDDVINGGTGQDEIEGGAGSDTILGDRGRDMIDGGGGNDDIEGGDDADTIDGGKGDDVIAGDNGGDTIDGGDGNDTLFGGRGSDVINGGSGGDTILGGPGNDRINGGSGEDLLNGGSGNDEINGGSSADFLSGDEGDDDLNGGGGRDEMLGGDGFDDLRGGGGRDDMRGGDGEDVLIGNNGNDTMRGNEGNDILRGGKGTDLLSGGNGEDELYGGQGRDRLKGGGGSDTLEGGADDDTYLFDTGVDDDVIQEAEAQGGNDIIQITSDVDFGEFDFARDQNTLIITFGGLEIEVRNMHVAPVETMQDTNGDTVDLVDIFEGL